MTILLRRIGGLVVAVATATAAMAVGVGSAAAAAPPAAITGPSSSIAPTSATLAGDLNAQGLPATWHFAYGTSTAYGMSTTHETEAAAAHIEGVRAQLDGLTPGTTYHYRLVVETAAGTAYGADASFATPARAPAIGKTTVGRVHDHTASVRASIDPNGLSTSWYVRYGPAGSGFVAATRSRALGPATSGVSVSLELGGLSPGTAYVAQLVAHNAAGRRAGATAGFATTGPPVITAESYRSLAPTTVTVSGVLAPGGHATRWSFEYGTTPAYGTRTVAHTTRATTASLDVARALRGLTANTTYHYRLVAHNSSGTTLGGDATFRTPGPSLRASPAIVQFGRAVTLSGTVPSGAADQPVALYGEARGLPSFEELATVLTGAGGTFTWPVAPRLMTRYEAIWRGEVTPVVAVHVRPGVMLRARPGSRFTTHVAGTRSFSGRLVRLQRFEHRHWISVAAARLNRGSAAVLHAHLPHGLSLVRIDFTAFQAGPGYLTSTSAVHRYHRR